MAATALLQIGGDAANLSLEPAATTPGRLRRRNGSPP